MFKPDESFNTDLHSYYSLQGFKACSIEPNHCSSYSRKDFYTIGLVAGHGIIHVEENIQINGTFLFFGNPGIPCNRKFISSVNSSYSCSFNEEFLLKGFGAHVLQRLSFFDAKNLYIFPVNPEQQQLLNDFFEKMIEVQSSRYVFKNELIAVYISLLIYEMQKIQLKQGRPGMYPPII